MRQDRLTKMRRFSYLYPIWCFLNRRIWAQLANNLNMFYLSEKTRGLRNERYKAFIAGTPFHWPG